MAQLGFTYLHAASVLRNVELRFSHPQYAMICQSIELLLKSWLRSFGHSVAQVTKMGHDLKRLCQQCNDHQLRWALDEETIGIIQLLSPIHKKRLFSYLETGRYTLPADINYVIGKIEGLWLEVYHVAHRATYGEDAPRQADRLPPQDN